MDQSLTQNSFFIDKLNYSLGNEDSLIEVGLSQSSKKILCIAGSGARLMPLFANEPEVITALDISELQLELSKLRLLSIKTFSFEDHLRFWGFTNASPDQRLHLFNKLPLDQSTKLSWQKYENIWPAKGWAHVGSWESSLRTLGVLFKKIFHADLSALFEAQNLREQQSLLVHIWPKIRMKLYFSIVANKYALNKLLYRGQLMTPGFELEADCASFLYQTFERLFKTTLARKNFLLQWIFLGEIKYPIGAMPETTPEIFEKIKKSKTQVYYKKSELIPFLKKSDAFDFYSLSDVVSYLSANAADEILGSLIPCQTRQLVVIRSFLKHPRKALNSHWRCETTIESESWQADQTGVYRFHIYSRN